MPPKRGHFFCESGIITAPAHLPPRPALPKIRAITLDLDDTLWPSAPTLARAEQRAHTWLAEHAPAVTARWPMESLRALRMDLFKQNPGLQHDFLRLRRMALQQAFAEAGQTSDAAAQTIEDALAVFMTARNEVALYPEVLDCLSRLSQRFRLASLTNGNADVRRIGLGDYFHATISAHAHGTSKPDPALFRIACDELACAPGEVVHVGDDADLDIRGARGAGLHTVWMNRTRIQWTGDDVPVVVNDLVGLERWLEQQR